MKTILVLALFFAAAMCLDFSLFIAMGSTTSTISARNNINPGLGCNGTDGNPDYTATLSPGASLNNDTGIASMTLSWPRAGQTNGFNATAIHIHAGGPDATGGVVVSICTTEAECEALNGVNKQYNLTGNPFVNTFANPHYLNFHSAACASGATRGQLGLFISTAAPTTATPTNPPSGAPTNAVPTNAPTGSATRSAVSVVLALAALLAALMF